MKKTNFIGVLHHSVKIIREAVANIVFIVLLIILAIFLQRFISKIELNQSPLPKQFTLVIAPQSVDEQTSLTIKNNILFSGAPTITSVHTLTEAIRRAKNDSKVKNLWINLSNFTPSGYGIVEELHQALLEFKSSGKPIYVFSDHYNNHLYLVASLADKIWLDPSGSVQIGGFTSSKIFVGNALKKWGIEAHVFTAGDYKSTPDTYSLTSRSQYDIEMTNSLLQSLHTYFFNTILHNRKHLNAQQKESILNPRESMYLQEKSLAEIALDQGIVDNIGTLHEALSNTFPDASFDIFNNSTSNNEHFISHKQYLESYHNSNSRKFINNYKPNITIINVLGTIVNGYSSDTETGSETIIEQLQSAVNEHKTKAIVLRINSPGGDSLASEKIYNTLKSIKEVYNIPIVVSMGSMAASGGYMVSLAADEIVAHPTTYTGSIGVFSLFFTAEEFAQKWGIYEDLISVSENTVEKPTFQTINSMTNQYIQKGVNATYKNFLEIMVASKRAETLEQAHLLAKGRVYSGIQAQELGLIDYVGDLHVAINKAAALANIEDNYEVITYNPPKDTIKEIINMLTRRSSMSQILTESGIYSLETLKTLTNKKHRIYALDMTKIL